MNILITENQLKSLIENILIEQQNNPDMELEKEKFYKESKMKIWFLENIVTKVKQITKPEEPDNIYYVDKNTGEEYMEYDKKSRDLYVNYKKIWSIFESNYSSDYMEIIRLIAYLMWEHYNLKDVTPKPHFGATRPWMLKHYNF